MGNNRFWNAQNPNQGEFTRVLCVCSAGLLRSPTVAWILSNDPFNCNTRAVGSVENFALVHMDHVMVHWADVIVFVSKENADDTMHKFDLSKKHLVTLNLPDEFTFRAPALVAVAKEQLLKAWEQLPPELQQV